MMFQNDDEVKEYFKYQRQHAIKNMFIKGNLSWEIKEDYNLFIRWFYFIKTLICLLFDRCRSSEYGIMIITYDEFQSIDSICWEYVSVGRGLFKGWQVQIGSDGT